MARPIQWVADHPKILEFIRRLEDGETMTAICAEDGMPDRQSIYNLEDRDPNFSATCARARLRQGDAEADKIAVLIEECTPETAPADRVKLEGRKWRAARLNPRYNDKIDHTVANPDGTNLKAFVTVISKLTRDDIAAMPLDALDVAEAVCERVETVKGKP